MLVKAPVVFAVRLSGPKTTHPFGPITPLFSPGSHITLPKRFAEMSAFLTIEDEVANAVVEVPTDHAIALVVAVVTLKATETVEVAASGF